VTFSIKKMEGSNKAHIEYWSKLEKVSSIMYVRVCRVRWGRSSKSARKQVRQIGD
jgi:hypothetical protein